MYVPHTDVIGFKKKKQKKTKKQKTKKKNINTW